MTVRHDDSLLKKDGECYANIMKISEGESWCRTCLSWSDVSEEKLKEFFRQELHTIFVLILVQFFECHFQ